MSELHELQLETIAPQPELEEVEKMTKDLRLCAKSLTLGSARQIFDTRQQIQNYRIAAAGQVRAQIESEESQVLHRYLMNQMSGVENNIEKLLKSFADARPEGKWAQSICGVGAVFAAGLLAHVQAEEGRSVSSKWRFAGLDPTVKWEKKTKRPWNAKLKVLCYLIGESFVKVSGRESDIYGKYYKARKEQEQRKNEAGEFAEQAKAALADKNYGKETVAREYYEKGMLPPAHIHARARRYAVKLFLSHYYSVAYFVKYGRLPAVPYAIAVLGHKDYIRIPNQHLIPGLAEAEEEMRNKIA